MEKKWAIRTVSMKVLVTESHSDHYLVILMEAD